MPEVLTDVQMPWAQGTSIYQSAFQFPWRDGVSVYGPTGTYTPGTPPGGTVTTTPIPEQPGGVIPARSVYAQELTFSLTDERDDSLLDATSITISTDEDSIFWTLNAQGGLSLFDALTAGEQPPVVLAELNGLQWRFVVDQVTRTRQFGENTTSVTGRSPSVLAGLPYERVQNWSVEGETTANQIIATANAFTELEIDWQMLDWNVPSRVFNLTGTPLDVVRSVAASVGAVVQSDRLENKVRILPRFPVLPGEWSCVVPDVEIAFEAMITESFQRIDQADYDGVYLSGQQQGLLGFVRLEGTNGGKQHPVVTDVLLTAEPALLQRGAAILGASGAGARTTASLPVLTGVGEAGVLTVGQLCRVLDPDLVWWGLVQSVSVTAAAGSLRQTVGFKRATVAAVESVVVPFVFDGPIPDQSGTVGEPFSLGLDPFWVGGEDPRSYGVRRGPLPPGVTFNQGAGTLSGTPTQAGTYTPIAIRGFDSVSNQADSNEFTFTVVPSATVLLMNFNNSLVDVAGHPFAADGTSFTTATTRYGSHALSVGGTSPSGGGTNVVYSTGTSADWDLNGGDFTMEGWVYVLGASGGGSLILRIASGSTDEYQVYATPGQLAAGWRTSAGSTATTSGAATVNTWTHFALSRQGDNVRFFVGGVTPGTVVTTYRNAAGAKSVFIGNNSRGFPGALYGYIDGIRVKKGIALYTANFTPPAGEFTS
jgi:Concanavalin A-like lectin/glucanases superfamily/Putative Ig domain